MARRGLQALHEICAGDPEGVAVNLLDAHLRNSTGTCHRRRRERADVSAGHLRQVAGLDRRARGSGAGRTGRATGPPRATSTTCGTTASRSGSTLCKTSCGSSTTPLVIPRWPGRRRAAADAQFASSRRSGGFESDGGRRRARGREQPDGRAPPTRREPRGHARGLGRDTGVDADDGRPRRPDGAAPRGARGGRARDRRRVRRVVGVVVAAGPPGAEAPPTFDTGPTSPLTAGSGDADLAANFANMQGKLEALQARMLEPALVEAERRAANAAFAAASADAQRLRAALDAAEAARDRAEGDLKAVRARGRPSSRERPRARRGGGSRHRENRCREERGGCGRCGGENCDADANALAAQRRT